MVDVARMPERSFGTVPTPAIVAPIEFTMKRADFAALGGHVDSVLPLDEVLERERARLILVDTDNAWPVTSRALLG
jgi:hypothetical protein